MRKIYTIAANTYREAVRDRVFYSLLVFAVLMLCFSMVLGNLTISQPVKIVKDFGLSVISIFGTLIAIFIGVSSVHKEIEKKTIYLILAKPISRTEFILGKYLGLSLVILLQLTVMTIGVFSLLYFVYDETTPYILLGAIFPIWVELQLILAVSLLFSSFSTPFLSGLFTFSVFIIGHLVTDLRDLAQNGDNEVLKAFSEVLYYVFPNLDHLNYKIEFVHGLGISMIEYISSILYGISYSILLLFLACLIFSKTDVK